MDNIFQIVAEYGPFPIGIMVGIWMKKWVVSQLIAQSKHENDGLRKEKQALIELVQAKEDRIDKLHDKLEPKNRKV